MKPGPVHLRDLFTEWLEEIVRDPDCPARLKPSVLGADLEEISQHCTEITDELRGLLDQKPSWDGFETTLYQVWSRLTQIVGHWSDVVNMIDDSDLSLESYFEGDDLSPES